MKPVNRIDKSEIDNEFSLRQESYKIYMEYANKIDILQNELQNIEGYISIALTAFRENNLTKLAEFFKLELQEIEKIDFFKKRDEILLLEKDVYKIASKGNTENPGYFLYNTIFYEIQQSNKRFNWLNANIFNKETLQNPNKAVTEPILKKPDKVISNTIKI